MVRSLLSVLSSRLHSSAKRWEAWNMGFASHVALWVIGRDTFSAALTASRWLRKAQNMASMKILRFLSSHRARHQWKVLSSFSFFVFFFSSYKVFSAEKENSPLVASLSFSKEISNAVLNSWAPSWHFTDRGVREKDFQILKQELQLLL